MTALTCQCDDCHHHQKVIADEVATMQEEVVKGTSG